MSNINFREYYCSNHDRNIIEKEAGLAEEIKTSFQQSNNDDYEFLENIFNSFPKLQVQDESEHIDNNTCGDNTNNIRKLLFDVCKVHNITILSNTDQCFREWLVNSESGRDFAKLETIYKLAGSIEGSVQLVIEENTAKNIIQLGAIDENEIDNKIFVALKNEKCLGFIKVNSMKKYISTEIQFSPTLQFGLLSKTENLGEITKNKEQTGNTENKLLNSLEIDYLCAAPAVFINLEGRTEKIQVSIISTLENRGKNQVIGGGGEKEGSSKKYLVQDKNYNTFLVEKIYYDQKRSPVGQILLAHVLVHFSVNNYSGICLTVAPTTTREILINLKKQGGAELFNGFTPVENLEWGKNLFINSETALWYHKVFGFQRVFPYEYLRNTPAKLWFSPTADEEFKIYAVKPPPPQPSCENSSSPRDFTGRAGFMYRYYPETREICNILSSLLIVQK